METYRPQFALGFATVLVLLAMWLAGHVLLLLFCGVLLAVLLHSLADLIGRPLGLPHAVGMGAALILLVALVAGAVYFVMPHVVHQGAELWDNIVVALEQLHAELSRRLPGVEFPTGQLPSASQIATQLFGLTTSLLDVLVTFGILIFVGIYAAADPGRYLRGFLRLFRADWRPRVQELLTEMGRALRWWLLGRAIAMSLVGVLVVVGLWLGGVNLPFALGLVAGLLTFIPYVGAIVSAVPAILIAFIQGPGFVIYVLAVFAVAHVIEAYVIVPLVQQRVIHLPPVLLLVAQTILGTLFGALGIAVAAPLAALAMVATRILYLRDVLGQPLTDEPGSRAG